MYLNKKQFHILGIIILISLSLIQQVKSIEDDNFGLGYGNVYKGNGNRWNGDYNTFLGNKNTAVGNSNKIKGDLNSVSGNNNLVIGEGNFIAGKGNVVSSGKSINKKQILQAQQQISKQIDQKIANMFNNKFAIHPSISYSATLGPVLKQQSLAGNSGLKRLQEMKSLTQNIKNNGLNFGIPFINAQNNWNNAYQNANRFSNIPFNPSFNPFSFNGLNPNNFYPGFINNQYPKFDNLHPINSMNFYGSNLRTNDYPGFINPAMFGAQNIFSRN